MDSWKEDNKLANRLAELVRNSYKQKEIIHFVKSEFADYSWRFVSY